MVSNKSLDEVNLIAALLRDFHKSHGVVFNNRALKLTTQVVFKRVRLEGLGFLTKTLPRLGKAFDQALSGGPSLNANALGFAAMRGSELPMFMGEFFKLVLHQDGTVLPCPCADSVRVLRQLLYLFYKYELPYSDKQERKVLDCFKKAEQDLHEHASILSDLSDRTDAFLRTHSRCSSSDEMVNVVRRAKHLLWKAFERFDPSDIVPRHGPGAVATKQQLWGKYQWSNVTRRITDVYPLDEYFFVNLEHVCDRQQELQALTDNENSARVILVPKDSRGPRLISCEPVDFQWVQQGLGEAIVRHIEGNKLTKFNVFFTDQGPNQRGALLGSSTGRYATLDLKEASDRVSLDLVRLLFPKHVYTYLEACRSLSTRMPDGEVIQLAKFAPMGSALCFPILALTIWSILSAGTRNTDTRESILVYGDDVIVPTAYAGKAGRSIADPVERFDPEGGKSPGGEWRLGKRWIEPGAKAATGQKR
jgi:IS1 family transposase